MPSDKVREPEAKPAPPPHALRYARTFQTETRPDRPAALLGNIRIPPLRWDQSAFPVPCAGTTSASDWPPRAARCGKSTSSGWTRRGNVSSRERLSETHLE